MEAMEASLVYGLRRSLINGEEKRDGFAPTFTGAASAGSAVNTVPSSAFATAVPDIFRTRK